MKNIRLDNYRRSVQDSINQGPIFETLKQKEKNQILHIKLDIDRRLIEVKQNFFEIGKLLSRAKSILPHGTFQRWIEETWGSTLPYPTAACYRAIYERFKDQREKIVLLPITLLQQMAQDSFPDEIIKLITDNPEAFSEGSITEVKGAYTDFKKGKIDLSQFEAMAAKQIAIGFAILEGQAIARHSVTGKRIVQTGFYELKAAIWKMRKYTGKIRSFFPPAEPMSFTDREVLDYNSKVDAMTRALLDDDLIREIDSAIEELTKLKAEVEERKGFFRERLVKEEGVITKQMISNL